MKYRSIYLIIFILLFTGCDMMMKTFSIKGYEDIVTYDGPTERNNKTISNNHIIVEYTTISLDPQGKTATYAILTIKNISNNMIQVENIEWNHIYMGNMLANIYNGPSIFEDAFKLNPGGRKIFLFETSKKEYDFHFDDIITVEIFVKYKIDEKENKLGDTIESVCHFKKRPISLP